MQLDRDPIARKHQLRIARDTMRMNPAMVEVMGGMSREDAQKILSEASRAAPDTLTNWEREQIASGKAIRDGNGIKLINPDMVVPPNKR